MKEILLNRMYVGSFLKTNIGHEVINLFRDDNGSNYIYVNPYGRFDKKHNDIESILLVRGINATTVEIIAKAIELTPILNIFLSPKNAKAEQEKYIDENKIKYGGVELYKIYQNNDEGKFSDRLLYISYKAGNILYPQNKIYLTTRNRSESCEAEYFLPEVNFPKQALHWTYNSESDAYKKIKAIVDNESLWEKKNRTKRLCDMQNDLKTDFNFLNLIQKEYDELSYSNMFYHFLSKNRSLFHDFMQDVLGLVPKGNYSIQREVNHIDLLIQDEENIIIIENKIKSGINGVRHDIYGELVQSQLGDYHLYADENANGRKESFFIFAPNYNRLDLRNYEGSKDYKVINYSILYNFFKKNHSNEKYYEDFLSALKIHSKEIDNSNFEIMQERLIDVIRSLKEN